MERRSSNLRPVPPGRDFRRARKEPVFEQIASFVGFFVYLLVLKSFFLPLFIIPTGSMAETLYGAHATHTCPNCGIEYPIGLPLQGTIVQCPNCHWDEHAGSRADASQLKAERIGFDAPLAGTLHPQAGDRIMVHGWPYMLGGPFGPQRWDVVVFKVPSDGQTNYIKRLIGKPGETVEIIDGDIFITDPQSGQPGIARKPEYAQRSLWFPCYNQDFPARQAAAGATYRPRWEPVSGTAGWSGGETRLLHFDGLNGGHGELQFETAVGTTGQPGLIEDKYGYNVDAIGKWQSVNYQRRSADGRSVSDVRLSCEITFEQVAQGGFIELSTTKYGDCFYARLYSDGRVTLERAPGNGLRREMWGEARADVTGGPERFALGNVDYTVSVEVGCRTLIRTTSAQYDVSAGVARQRRGARESARLRIVAESLRATLAHVLIERDVYYTSEVTVGLRELPGYGIQGHPIKLRNDEYFVLGDNSPSSLDARFSFAQRDGDPVGPQLKAAYEAGDYQLGTVPADQLIGPAFLVYWPGTEALLSDRYLPEWLKLLNQLPGPGRIRWIH